MNVEGFLLLLLLLEATVEFSLYVLWTSALFFSDGVVTTTRELVCIKKIKATQNASH